MAAEINKFSPCYLDTRERPMFHLIFLFIPTIRDLNSGLLKKIRVCSIKKLECSKCLDQVRNFVRMLIDSKLICFINAVGLTHEVYTEETQHGVL